MTTTSIEERKRNVKEIKASFPESSVSAKFGALNPPVTEEVNLFRFSKIRILISVLIFAAFIYCDQTQVKINGYTTKDIYKQIEKTFSVEKIMQSVENVL